MSDIRTLFRSFAGGEITPEMYGRQDMQKFQTGLGLCRNFRTLPHGPAVNRTGLQFVIRAKYADLPSRLVPFIYSDNDRYVLEFGDEYIRFHTDAGTVVRGAINIVDISNSGTGLVTANAHGASVGEWVYLAEVEGMTEVNGRYFQVGSAAANTVGLFDLDGNPFDTSAFAAYTGGGTLRRVYEISTPYDIDDLELLEVHYTQSNNRITFVHPFLAQRELQRIAPTNWSLTTIGFDPSLDPPANVSVVARLDGDLEGTEYEVFRYCVTAVGADGTESFASDSDAVNNQIWNKGNTNTITWDAVVGARRYNIYRDRGGLFSYIGQAKSLIFIDDNIAPDTATTPPEPADVFDATGDYPATAGFYEQRRVFAGSDNEPQNVWMTRSGNDYNMASSLPIRDDDALNFRISSREANSIRHVVALDDLILLTAAAVWKVYSKNSDALTPASASAKVFSFIGASTVQPVTTGDAILYAMSRGGHLAELRYKEERVNYFVSDASIMAPHLFDGHTIVDMAFQRAPYPTLWVVRDDGVLLSLSYVPEHEVLGWHQHDTHMGNFEAVAVIPEGNEDGVYFTILRELPDASTIRTIERMHNIAMTTVADGFYVDSGITYEVPEGGDPVDELVGFYHLEGHWLNVLIDGAQHRPVQVINGRIQLDYEGFLIHAGLGIEADFETLPLFYEGAGLGEGVMKNINSVAMRVFQSSSIFAGPSFDRLTEYPQRTNEPFNTPPTPISDVIVLVIEPEWTYDARVCVRHTAPLPLRISSMALEVAVGE